MIHGPSEAIGGAGPVFEYIDPTKIYVLISTEFFDGVLASTRSKLEYNLQLGILIGDMMRRGVYYAENITNNKEEINE